MVEPIKLIDANFSASESGNYDLSIELSYEGAAYCVLDKDNNKFIAFESVTFEHVSDQQQLVPEFSKWAANESIFGLKFNAINIMPSVTPCTLAPSSLYLEEKKMEIISCVADIQPNDLILSDQLKIIDAWNIYTMPKDLSEAIKNLLKDAQIRHYSSVLIDNIMLRYRNNPAEIMVVNVHGSYFEALVLKGKDLVLFNKFQYQTKEDFTYYILYIYDQLKLNQEHTELVLSGQITEQSEIFQLIYQYIANISFMERNNHVGFSYKFSELPGHYYFNLLNHYS